MSIADELALLANTKESLRVAIGLSTSIPFSQYAVNIPWVGDVIPATGIVFDFKKNRYAKDGKAVYLDDVSEFIRLSSATKWRDGQLVEVADNAPRISGEGLLNEEQRTNLIPYSASFTSGAWTVENCTASANASKAPDGTDTATLVTPAAGTGGRWVRIANKTSPRSNSYFVKSAGCRYVALAYSTTSTSVTFDLETGETLAGVVIVDFSVQRLPNGWWRISHTVQGGVLNTLLPVDTMRLVPYNGASSTFNGTDGIYLWGAQIEEGSFPTSYIPTKGTPATRSPDILNIPLLPTQTITGDWDDGVTYSLAGGIATFTGHGYIRNITVEAL